MDGNLVPIACRLVLTGVAVSFISACSSKPKKTAEQPTVAQFQAQIRIQDKAKNENHLVNGQIRVLAERLRVDFNSSGLGMYLGTLVSRSEGVKLLMARERKVFESPNPNASLKQLVGYELKPFWILAIVQDRVPGEDFSCTFNFDQKPMKCTSVRDPVVLEWEPREGTSRKTTIRSPQAEIQIAVTEKPSKVQDPEPIFNLEIPQGYEVKELD